MTEQTQTTTTNSLQAKLQSAQPPGIPTPAAEAAGLAKAIADVATVQAGQNGAAAQKLVVVTKPFAGMYKNIRGQHIIKADGTKMKQVNGHFDPKTAEEKELCQYFEAKGMIEAVK